jgi:Barrel-sandwich domain of CusB or HlyD membrane-fusion
MNSPSRAHPVSSVEQQANTIPFPAPPAPPRQGPNRLEILLALEADIRRKPNKAALALHAVNDTRAVLKYGQAFFVRLNSNGKPVIQMASSMARLDMHVPLLKLILKCLVKIKKYDAAKAVDLTGVCETEGYPFNTGMWVPLCDGKDRVFGGLLLVDDVPLAEADLPILKRLAETYAHAYCALSPPQLLRTLSIPKWAMWILPVMLVALVFIPVPMASLAPFEVIGKDPAMITAPIDGAISQVVAEPNRQVKAGELLFTYDQTILRADAEMAGQRLLVAQAKLSTAKNAAFGDVEAKRQLAELQSEVDLATAEGKYASELLKRSEVRAPVDGLLIYSSRSDWEGKPVRVGEKIMEVADPSSIAYKIDLGVHDAVSLQTGNVAEVFFDADPLHPRSAQVSEMSYHALEKQAGVLSFLVKALPTGDEAPMRIGLRGTARLSGESVSLGFYLFRRPIAALRQYFGI